VRWSVFLAAVIPNSVRGFFFSSFLFSFLGAIVMRTIVALGNDSVSETAAETATPHVLVVDSRFEDYMDLARAARQGQIQVHFRSSAVAARALMRRLRFDLCIVGADLDDMAGEDFLELLRADPDRGYRECGPAVEPLAGVREALTAAGKQPNRVADEPRFAVPDGLAQVSGSLVISAVAAAAALGAVLIR
jgi:CheY-like chemotaxis protein